MQAIEKMERETKLEPATSSLGIPTGGDADAITLIVSDDIPGVRKAICVPSYAGPPPLQRSNLTMLAPRRRYWNVIVTLLAVSPSTVAVTVTVPDPASESGSATLI